MSNVLRRLWADDRGAVISTELVLVIGIVIFGLIPGLVALRNSVIAALGTIGNVITTIVPSFTFSGFAIGRAGGGGTIVKSRATSAYPTTTNRLTGLQITPISLGTLVVIPPAP